MKYTIIGSGPTGLSLAYILGINGYNIDLIEQSSTLGGSWNSEFIDKDFWSENSPRVIVTGKYTKYLLQNIGMNKDDLHHIYGNFFETYYKFFEFFYYKFDFNDYYKFLSIFLQYSFKESNFTLQNVLDNSDLTKNAKDAITLLCITVNDIPSKTNINEFLETLKLKQENLHEMQGIQQFKDSNKWHNIIEKKLNKLDNVKIFKNTKIIKLLQKNNNIYQAISDNNQTFNLDKVFLCTQSNGLLNILENCDFIIQNNWYKYDYFKEWASNTFYNGIGFQLHFNSEVIFSEEWCKSCWSDWNIIILPVSDWLLKKSKNPDIKTVWSCTITNLDVISKNIKKTVNQCSIDEIIKESIYQLKLTLNIPKPTKVTVSKGLYKKNNKWVSYNTGFTRGSYHYLPMKGKISNLFALGAFNDTDYTSVALFETAIRATVKYLQQYEPTVKGFHKTRGNDPFVISILAVLFLL